MFDPPVRPLPLHRIQLQLSKTDVDARDVFLETGDLLGEDGVGEKESFRILEGVFDFNDGGIEEGGVSFMGAGRCRLASRVSEFRGVLEAFMFAPMGTPAMIWLPKEQHVHRLTESCVDACLLSPPTPIAQGFARPVHEQGVEELVRADKDMFSVDHAASTSPAAVTTSTTALHSPPCCIVPFLRRMAPPA